jgi:hypothetical protein
MTALAAYRPALPPDAIDVAHLLAQAPDLADRPDDGYLTEGLARRLNPTPWFDTDWYAWQNPDWSEYASPYLHYLEKGCAQGRDPSPFVDIPRYCDMTKVPAHKAYGLICAGFHAPALGIYENRDDLARCQDAFRAGLQLLGHRVTKPRARRAGLVVLQAGRGLPVELWSDAPDRAWDLMVNYYDAAGFQAGLGDYAVFQKGTKFTAMWMLWQRFRSVLLDYDHVLFLDDDVETTCADLNKMFEMCRKHQLDLAQMSLSKASFTSWSALFSRPGITGPRSISAVEIMMPVFSRKALNLVSPSFGQSISGFGLDLVWGKLVSQAGGRIAILDEVQATHARPVDQAGGAYYSYLRRHMINAKAELWQLLKDYDADRNLMSS